MNKALTGRPSKGVIDAADLSPAQRRFVDYYAEMGHKPGGGADAALAAGYGQGKNRESAKVRASELLRSEKILNALRDALTRKLNSAATLGVNTLIDLVLNAQSEQVRLSAAQQLIDRSSIGPIISRSAHLHATGGVEELLEKLDAQVQAAEAEVPPTTEASFVEIDPTSDE